MAYVLILGATSDIALEIAKKYAGEGYDLHLAGRKISQLERIKNDLCVRYERDVKVCSFDALRYENHQAFYKQLYPEPEITVLVFGAMYEEEEAIKDWTLASKMIHTNYTGAVSILNIIANDYIKKAAGTIIGISSVAGDRGRKSKLIYGSAKAAFSTYLSGLRNWCAHHEVHVMSVKPGFVATQMTEHLNLPKSLTAQPDQVAKAVFNAVKKKKNVIYVKWFWRYIMLIIKLIPEPIFKKLNL